MNAMHLDQEQIERLLHGELTAPMQNALHEHMTRCAACRSRVVQAEQEQAQLNDLLRHLDHSLAPPDAAAMVATARTASARLPAPDATSAQTWTRWAAGLALTVGIAGAVYAAPGWLARLNARNNTPDPPAAAPPVEPQQDAGGLIVTPGIRLSIQFEHEQLEGSALVALTDGRDVVVRVLEGSASFESDEHRLSISNRGSQARFEILLPRTAPWLEIRAGARRLFLKEGARIDALAPLDHGRYTLRLARPG
jgi:hypothetical protein